MWKEMREKYTSQKSANDLVSVLNTPAVLRFVLFMNINLDSMLLTLAPQNKHIRFLNQHGGHFRERSRTHKTSKVLGFLFLLVACSFCNSLFSLSKNKVVGITLLDIKVYFKMQQMRQNSPGTKVDKLAQRQIHTNMNIKLMNKMDLENSTGRTF